jgi:hypothetical protein
MGKFWIVPLLHPASDMKCTSFSPLGRNAYGTLTFTSSAEVKSIRIMKAAFMWKTVNGI